MGQQTKDKHVIAQKWQGLSFSSFLTYLFKPFKKRTLKETLFCALGFEMAHGEDLRGINPRRSFNMATRDEKIQKFGATRSLRPNIRTTGGPSRTETTAPLHRKNPFRSPLKDVRSAASISNSALAAAAAAANHKKPHTPPTVTSASTNPPSSKSKAASASINAMQHWTTVPQSASLSPGRDSPLSGGTTSASESPETLYLAIYPHSSRSFIESNPDSVRPISVSYCANSPTNSAYKYSSTPSLSPSVDTDIKCHDPASTMSSKSGAKFVHSSPVALSQASYNSRDDSASGRSEVTYSSPTAKSEAGQSSTKWADDEGQHYVGSEADSISPASPFNKVVNKYAAVRRSAASSLTQMSPESQTSSWGDSADIAAEEEQQPGLSILRPVPQTGARSSGSSFSPYMRRGPCEPDRLQYNSKPRSIAAKQDSRVNVSKGLARHESSGYQFSPLSSAHESDNEESMSGLNDIVNVEQATTRPISLADLWALEGKQSSPISGPVDAGSQQQPDYKGQSFAKNFLLRSRSSVNIAALDGETATSPKTTPQSSFKSTPRMKFDRAKDFLNLFIKATNGGGPLSRSESTWSHFNAITGRIRHSRRTNLTDFLNKRRMSRAVSAPNIAKLVSDAEIAKSEVQAPSRAGSPNSRRSKLALKLSSKNGEVQRDVPMTPASDHGSQPNESVDHITKRNSFGSVLDNRKSVAELPDKFVSVVDNPLYSPSLAEYPRHVLIAMENPLYVLTRAHNTTGGVTDEVADTKLNCIKIGKATEPSTAKDRQQQQQRRFRA